MRRVLQMARTSEELFGTPQDMEWTFAGDDLIAMQSRPITRRTPRGPADQRP